MKKFDVDLLVIGGGVAGKTAAVMAAGLGKKVAIVEEGVFGGTAQTYDVPMAAASTMARAYHGAIEGVKFGVGSGALKYNYPSVLNWIETAKMRAGYNDDSDLVNAGVKCYRGRAQMVSANEVSITGSENVTAAKILIATGAGANVTGVTGVEMAEGQLKMPGLQKAAACPCMLARDVFALKRIPKVALVVGAGATGCEVAEYLAEMGSKVLLSEISERVLPKEDPEAGEVIEKRLSALEVKVLTGSRVIAVQDGGTQQLPTGRRIQAVKATFMRGGQEKSVRVESVIFCTGSVPNTDIGLKSAGVNFTNKGIVVNGSMQTNVKSIYAVGDCAAVKIDKKPGQAAYTTEVPNVSSTERAVYEAAVAVTNMCGGGRPVVDYRGFVRMTNTFPAVACVGLTEDECMVRDKKYSQILVPLERCFMANVADAPDGFVKILMSKDKIVGATVVAPEAATMMQEIVLAIRGNISLLDLATAPHAAQSWAEAVKIAAKRLAK